MVLRGSKTHPSSPDIIRLERAIKQLRKYLKSIDTQESSVEHEIAGILHQRERLESKMQHDALTTADATTAILESTQPATEISSAVRVLMERLEYLEQMHDETAEKISETELEISIAVKQFLCGGLAGMTARSVVAPVDRVKILLQTAFTTGSANRGLLGTAMHEIRNGGVRVMWKGNFTNCIRVFPYAALQFASYERYKSLVMDWTESNNREFGFLERILSGAMAGATAATLTYPLDVMRIRQVVYNDVRGPIEAFHSIYAEGGARCFFKGWTPTLMSLAPFIAMNFATFDYLKSRFIEGGDAKNASTLLVLGLGAGAGLTAQTFCYPLDTIRRSMQLKGENYNGILDCVAQIWRRNNNPSGFYKGIIPNAIKIIPNNGIRFLMYTKLCSFLDIPEKKIRPKRKD